MKNNILDISIVICTYNRSDSLKRTLEYIKEMSVPESIKWELLVVDNNSKDDTKEIIECFVENSGVNCRYVFENNQGLSHARNSGISQALGEIIVFTDDDVIVDRHWLKNIVAAFHGNDVACIGGKILPEWEKPCPTWLNGIMLDYLALCDLGDARIKLSRPTVWGANLSVKASIFREYGCFDTEFGHKGGKLYGGEETKYLQNLLDNGESILYCPDILVYHCIPEHRMRKSYFRKWMHDKGELNAIQMGEYTKRNILGVPYNTFKKTIIEFKKYIRDQIGNPDKAFHHQLELYYYIGMIKGRINYTKGKYR